MSAALTPSLRPRHLPSLPSASHTTTYICAPVRHARLLRRPKRPYTFTQLVTLSDGSAFTMRTTSPVPVYRSTRDTRNAPLWNPSSRDLLNVEDDEAGRLAGFRARFGSSFDAVKESAEPKTEGEKKAAKADGKSMWEMEENMFEEDDMGLLELISSYGKEDHVPKAKATAGPVKKGGKK